MVVGHLDLVTAADARHDRGDLGVGEPGPAHDGDRMATLSPG